jgi:hypothetical protein
MINHLSGVLLSHPRGAVHGTGRTAHAGGFRNFRKRYANRGAAWSALPALRAVSPVRFVRRETLVAKTLVGGAGESRESWAVCMASILCS